MERLVELSRVGSDPELSVAIPDENKQLHLLSADRLVGSDKELRLRSFIGTDGHASTAELRPSPCRNVYWHLIKIADGLAEIKNSMHYFSALHKVPLVAVAQPSLSSTETMGGHIWISMWYKSALAHALVHKAGLVWDNMRHDYYRSMQDAPREPDKMPRPISDQKIRLYAELAKRGEELCLDLCWKKLHYLIWPLENYLYGNVRQHRAGAGVRDPFVRVPDRLVPAEQALQRKGYAYFRFEYRIPSTWLQHPTLAFAYLGLAKLAVLNWDILPSLTVLNETLMPTASAVESAQHLQARLVALKAHPHFRITKDLSGLFEAITSLCSIVLKFPALIDFDAWASLKPPTIQITEEGDSW